MNKTFVYGKSVEAENFTDRVKETARLKANLEHGVNTIIISPRRMGKTSLVRKVQASIDAPDIKVVYMDIYDCRSEYDFLNKFAATLMKETAGQMDRVLDTLKEFLTRITPRISYSPEPLSDFTLSLGITPQNYTPEEILNLPETIARKRGIQMVVCIDEFQQIGDFNDSITVQKRMRGVWQHQQNVAYCMFGSKKHMMTQIFQSRRMPFYQFGEMMFLNRIPREDWVDYIQRQFAKENKQISIHHAGKICDTVECYSSYVQQLAWDVLLETTTETTDQNLEEGINTLIDQNAGLFLNQIEELTSYQMNFLRAVCSGYDTDFTSKEVSQQFDLGAKSNVQRIKNTLVSKEIIDVEKKHVYISDPVFKLWFARTCVNI